MIPKREPNMTSLAMHLAMQAGLAGLAVVLAAALLILILEIYLKHFLEVQCLEEEPDQQEEVPKGTDLHFEMELSFEESIFGVEKEIPINKMHVCSKM